jgi:hypothetical protein
MNREEARMSTGGSSKAFITTAIIMVSLLSGCGDDGGTGTGPSAPELPPISSFLMDFSDFAETDLVASPGTAATGGISTKLNWSWAAGNVLVWNTLITVGLAVPTAAFVEAFHHEATRQPDGTWVWDYNFVAQSTVHLAELHGWIEGEEVNWEMYISKEGEYTDFLWYEGHSDLEVSEGTWTLYASPADPTCLIGIEWHRFPESGSGDIRYTNIVPEGPENGGYIFYGTTTDEPFDAFYDIYNKGLDNHTTIEWSRTTKTGRVLDSNHFGDADWHCWDSDLNDILCP